MAIPLALIWALVFALLTVVHVWILSPALRLLDLILAVVKKVRFTIELIFYRILALNYEIEQILKRT